MVGVVGGDGDVFVVCVVCFGLMGIIFLVERGGFFALIVILLAMMVVDVIIAVIVIRLFILALVVLRLIFIFLPTPLPIFCVRLLLVDLILHADIRLDIVHL